MAMRAVDELELPELDPNDPELRGDRWESVMRELRELGSWLVRAPLGVIVLDRTAGEQFLRTKSAIFPGLLLAEIFGIEEGPLHEQMTRNIININGKDHSRLRGLINPALSPARGGAPATDDAGDPRRALGRTGSLAAVRLRGADRQALSLPDDRTGDGGVGSGRAQAA